MLELPETTTLAMQVTRELAGLQIRSAVAGASDHTYAGFTGEPPSYSSRLQGQHIVNAQAYGGLLEISTDDWVLVFNDGACLQLLSAQAARPVKHQLLLEFDDGRALLVTVRMYGGIFLLGDVEEEMSRNPYIHAAHQAIPPMNAQWTVGHLRLLVDAAKPSLSAKALLATEQRIPGLGNGCLQDILWTAGIQPQRKISTLTTLDLEHLHDSIQRVLTQMIRLGGRNTEKDLYSKPGGYTCLMSAKTCTLPCPQCAGPVTRKSFLGGNVYFCPYCQPINPA